MECLKKGLNHIAFLDSVTTNKDTCRVKYYDLKYLVRYMIDQNLVSNQTSIEQTPSLQLSVFWWLLLMI